MVTEQVLMCTSWSTSNIIRITTGKHEDKTTKKKLNSLSPSNNAIAIWHQDFIIFILENERKKILETKLFNYSNNYAVN